MEINALSISGAFEIRTTIFPDERGVFLEAFHLTKLRAEIGHEFLLRQANTSVSHKGVLRGIHFADVPPGQAKYVMVPYGAVLDFIVDIRLGSPTFGQWTSVEINDSKRNAVYISEGLGHAFLSLRDQTVVNYLVSDIYKPQNEHGINPLDAEINLEFPQGIGDLVISPKDLEAPTLQQLKTENKLPTLENCNHLHRQI